MKLITLTAAFVVAFARAAYAVDGVIEINQARALAGGVTPDDTPGFPVTISQTGSYKFTGNLLVPGGSDGIIVTADNVAIDLNGFAMVGPTTGITNVGHSNLGVTNGSIISVRRHGIDLGQDSHVERVRVDGTEGSDFGIRGLTRTMISGCVISSFRGAAISIRDGLVTGNLITQSKDGIDVGSGSLVTGNTILGYTQFGLHMTGGAYGGNTIDSPILNAHAIWHFDSGTRVVQLGPNNCNDALCP